jgi:hypothetical protein
MDVHQQRLLFLTNLASNMHQPVVSYLLTPPDQRDPLQITPFIATLDEFLHFLTIHVYRHVEKRLYAHYYQTTAHLREQLISLEQSLLNNHPSGNEPLADRFTPIGRGNKVPIHAVNLEQLVHLGFTDRQLATVFGCSVSTIKRRRCELGFMKHEPKHRISDDNLDSVSNCVPSKVVFAEHSRPFRRIS